MGSSRVVDIPKLEIPDLICQCAFGTPRNPRFASISGQPGIHHFFTHVGSARSNSHSGKAANVGPPKSVLRNSRTLSSAQSVAPRNFRGSGRGTKRGSPSAVSLARSRLQSDAAATRSISVANSRILSIGATAASNCFRSPRSCTFFPSMFTYHRPPLCLRAHKRCVRR